MVINSVENEVLAAKIWFHDDQHSASADGRIPCLAQVRYLTIVRVDEPERDVRAD